MSDGVVILGIESSCDETACALVADGRDVLSGVVASQIDLHARFGGVVPEVASRAHIEAVNGVIQRALDQSGVVRDQIHAVAVTCEPGLIGSLLVGLMAAKTLAWAWRLPLVGVNHVYAHAYAPALDDDPIEYPAAALICSGGHTALYHCLAPARLELLGSTIDDAAGEAFDKVANILRLGFPGGPAVDEAARNGDPTAVEFPRSLLAGQSLDFSFSGLKTAVLYHVQGVPGASADRPRRRRRVAESAGKGIDNLSEREIADIAASFQAAVVDVLRIKLRRAARRSGAKTLILGGGVGANTRLRAAIEDLGRELGCRVRMPKMPHCVDNAAMIAGLGYHYFRAGKIDGYGLEARATVRR